MRWFGCLVVAALAPVASASFDMMIWWNVNTNRMQRYDPINRLSLGSFGPSTSLDNVTHSGNLAYTSAFGSKWFAYDYSTGQQVASTVDGRNINTNLVVDSTGRLTYGVSSSVLYLDSINDPTATTLATISGATVKNIVDVGNGYLMVQSRTSTGTISLATVNKTTGVVSTLGTTYTTGDVSFGQMVLHRDTDGSNYVTMARRITSGGVFLETFFVGSAGTITHQSTFVLPDWFSATTDSRVNLVSAHNGFWAVGRDFSTPATTRLIKFDSDSLPSMEDSFLAPEIVTFGAGDWTMTCVVAPEPGSLGVLALGGFALLRRRRR
ncbi:MAG: PEP-CTERM sorting domain-containing protein [Chthonomonas sp.]|nr:PEP-CTERM sorting domain-containing protein [Chthonomonas sp.]